MVQAGVPIKPKGSDSTTIRVASSRCRFLVKSHASPSLRVTVKSSENPSFIPIFAASAVIRGGEYTSLTSSLSRYVNSVQMLRWMLPKS